MKYHVNLSNEIAVKYTIKEILEENWDEFVDEMLKQGKTIRPSIMREVDKVIGCQDP